LVPAYLAIDGLTPAGGSQVWKAQEDGMKLAAADDVARQSLASSKAAVGQQNTGAAGGAFSGGLGRHMAHLERRRRSLHLAEKRYELEAGMERTRAHLERVQAADETRIARSDLDQASHRPLNFFFFFITLEPRVE